MTDFAQPALKHWARIIKRWPVDKVRPDSVSFQTIMQKRIDRVMNPSTSAAPSNVKANEALVSTEPRVFDEKKEMQQVNVLSSLLGDRYATAYPLPQSLRKPASNPVYYDQVLAEIEEAPSRSWWASTLKSLKGRFRIK